MTGTTSIARSRVREDFRRKGITVYSLSSRRLRRLPDRQYSQLVGLVSSFPHLRIRRVIVPKFSEPEKIDFSSVSERALIEASRPARAGRGRVLDLGELQTRLARHNKERYLQDLDLSLPRPRIELADSGEQRALQLIDLIRGKRAFFKSLPAREKATIHEVVMKIEADRYELGFLNMVITYPNPEDIRNQVPARAVRWVRSQENERPDLGYSGYNPKTGGKIPESTIESLIKHPGEQVLFLVDIAQGKEASFTSQNLVVSPTRDKDLEHFKGPTEMLFVRLLAHGETVAVIHLHNRVHKSEEADPPEFLPYDGISRGRILTEIETYFRVANWALSSIEKRAQGSKKPTMEMEELGPFSPTLFSDESREADYMGLKIEVNRDPALHFYRRRNAMARQLVEFARDCIGEEMGAGEMKAHTIFVNHAEFVREGERLAAFGSARHFDNYINHKGKREKLTLLWGTMVHSDYRRKGLMIKLNYDLISEAKMAVRNSIRGWFAWIRRVFAPAPITVRTQSLSVFEACARHFKGVVRPGKEVNPRHQHMTKFIAGKEGWHLDENNIQKNAYEKARVHEDKDRLPGLGPRDAYVFSGDFTLWREILTKFMLNLYRFKNWIRGKGFNKIV